MTATTGTPNTPIFDPADTETVVEQATDAVVLYGQKGAVAFASWQADEAVNETDKAFWRAVVDSITDANPEGL